MAAHEAGKSFEEGIVEVVFGAGQQSEARVAFPEDRDGQDTDVFFELQSPDKIDI